MKTNSQLSEDIIKKFNLKLSEKSIGGSHVLGCVFYSFDKDTYLTNYNVNNEKSMAGSGLWMIVDTSNCKSVIVTEAMLNNYTSHVQVVINQIKGK